MHDPGRRRARRARVRRRLAVGGGRRRTRRRAGRSRRSNKVVQRIDGRATRRVRWPWRRARCGSPRARDGRRARGSTSAAAASRARSRLGANPTALAAGAGAVWVASEEAGTVTRVDPRSGAVVAGDQRRQRADAPWRSGEGAVWVVNRARRHALARRPRHERGVRARRASAPTRPAVAVGDGHGVGGRRRGRDRRRASTRAARACSRRLRTGSSLAALTVAGARCGRRRPLRRRRTAAARCGCDLPNNVPIPANWLPATATLPDLDADVARLRRARGLSPRRRSAGATLWARSRRARRGRAPTAALMASRCARGCATPMATPFQPGDFRASMERLLRATGDGFPPYYSRIVGARRCVRRRARCNLSRGIEIGRGHGEPSPSTSRSPDADFLHKLTLPFAFVVPAGTPASTASDLAPLGTGPYRIAAWDSGAADGSSVTRASARPRRGRRGSPTGSSSRRARRGRSTRRRRSRRARGGRTWVLLSARRSTPRSAHAKLASRR